MEEALGEASACKGGRAGAARASGPRVQDLVLNGLPDKARKQGVKGALYKKEQPFFDNVAARTFYSLGVRFPFKHLAFFFPLSRN